MEVFRKKITAFAERWKKHVAACERAEKKRMRHWQKVKSDPRLQDKGVGQPKKGWEWDRTYLYNLLSDVGPKAVVFSDKWYARSKPYRDRGPEHEIPARHVPIIMAAVDATIKHNESEMQRYAKSSHEYQRLAESIPILKQDLAELHYEFDTLNPAEKTTAWVKTPCRCARTPGRVVVEFQWWDWLDITEEEVFGCWRPRLQKVPEHPCKRLIPLQNTGKLPPASDTTEEYERYYVSLASIHDNQLPGCESITKPVWADGLAEQVWFRFSQAQPYGPDRAFIEAALNRVSAELDARSETRPESEKKRTLLNRARGWLWQLYEVTIKALFEVILNRASKP